MTLFIHTLRQMGGQIINKDVSLFQKLFGRVF